jgi:hypothetical protein
MYCSEGFRHGHRGLNPDLRPRSDPSLKKFLFGGVTSYQPVANITEHVSKARYGTNNKSYVTRASSSDFVSLKNVNAFH